MNSAPIQAVAIGGSAGALHALSVILRDIPADYGLPIFITVHIPPERKSVLAEVLQMKCRLTVREADDKEPIVAGSVYVAPPDYHLLVEKDRTVALSSDEPVFYSRPAIDVMLESAADAYGSSLLGIVLSGASGDGAKGLKAIQDGGGVVMVEDPHAAYASTMPLAALDACSEATAVSLEQMAEYLKGLRV